MQVPEEIIYILMSKSRCNVVCTSIYNIWTSNSVNLECLADKFFDGRIDTLGLYLYDECEEGGTGAGNNNNSISNNEIDREEQDQLSYDTFVSKYMSKNLPVIIKNLTEPWPITNSWTKKKKKSTNRTLNTKYMKKNYGECNAPVHITTLPLNYKESGYNFGGSTRPATTHQTVCDYVEWWEGYVMMRDFEEEEGEEPQIDEGTTSATTTQLQYLKDWKFTSEFPNIPIYTCPKYFEDDWLNNYKPSYKFVYLGPKDTSTRLHADVLRSYSWSSNIFGLKRWYLIPSEYTYLLYDVFGVKLAPHLFYDLEVGGVTNNGRGNQISIISYYIKQFSVITTYTIRVFRGHFSYVS